MAFDIDWAFIARSEGAAITTGYVPKDARGNVIDQSGVTIATGFDLGQHGQADLDRLFAAHPKIVTALQPYLGLRRAAAVAALERTPLTITDDEAAVIDRAVKLDKATALARVYDAAVAGTRTRRNVTFRSLPREAQTVIMSVAFQYGTRLELRTPRFWRAVVARDWARAVTELRNFGDRYPTRRAREAEYLSALVVPAR